VTQQSPAAFREDVTKAKSILEDITGVAIAGYRAPSYSIGRGTLWALEVLETVGYRYSSSIFPIQHDLYGMPEAPRFAFRPGHGRLLEIPVTTVRVAGRTLPCGGGGWFRIAPYALFKQGLGRVNRHEGRSGVFYFHPWEIDPGQPRIREASLKSRFRHYVNLSRMQARLKRLLADFRWGRMDQVFPAGAAHYPVVDLEGLEDTPLSFASSHPSQKAG
jgi:polysaccharide deacetylase family protein (PEP-CTERM system associated)